MAFARLGCLRVQQIKLALLPKDAMDERNVIVEVRAGTGGDEASLFAGDLFRMYERYAATQGWRVELASASEGDAGGYAWPVVRRRPLALDRIDADNDQGELYLTDVLGLARHG